MEYAVESLYSYFYCDHDLSQLLLLYSYIDIFLNQLMRFLRNHTHVQLNSTDDGKAQASSGAEVYLHILTCHGVISNDTTCSTSAA